jgi:hypothetical protein
MNQSRECVIVDGHFRGNSSIVALPANRHFIIPQSRRHTEMLITAHKKRKPEMRLPITLLTSMSPAPAISTLYATVYMSTRLTSWVSD